MPASIDPQQGNFAGIKLFQLLAVTNRYEPVFCAMDNIGMAVYMPDPPVGAQMIPQNIFNRKQG